METSRGSVCYHLGKLLTAKKLQKVYAGNVPQYYLVPVPNLTEDPLEQTLRQLLSRKKSGGFLRTLYEHPDATRKELAETLNVLPTTIHWYLHSYANEHIVLITKTALSSATHLPARHNRSTNASHREPPKILHRRQAPEIISHRIFSVRQKKYFSSQHTKKERVALTPDLQ